jgi:hypothetical protein
LFNSDGTPKLEAQPPYLQIRGRLTVPGLGVKEQYGTKILVGGASEQEGASKSASTDALKKCATLFGIGLELYGGSEETSSTPATSYNNNKYNNSNNNKGYANVQSYNSTPAPAQVSWEGKEGEVKKLKELKAILGVADNQQLNPYVAEFTGIVSATYELVTPNNIAAFNKFLMKKAESV